MIQIIEARRVESRLIDVSFIKKVWDEYDRGIILQNLSVPLNNLMHRVKEDYRILKNMDVKQKIGLYTGNRGKLWLIHHYNYVYYGKLDDIYHRWYGYLNIYPIILRFNIEVMMYIRSRNINGKIEGGARRHVLIPQNGMYIFGQAQSEIVNLKFLRIRNILKPIWEYGQLKEVSQ